MKVAIHCEPGIPWQGPFANKMAAGLTALGIENAVTNSRERQSDIAILLGTTCWRGIEATGKYLLVDRCSFGDTNQYVSLVWDGHGRRGNHCVPEHYDGSRWARHGVPLKPWRSGSRVVLCGQTETYSPHWDRIEDWYASETEATHFRPHPAGDKWQLPIAKDWTDARKALTLNSSVAVDAIINGVHVGVADEGGMAWGFVGDREHFFRRLAWTQWHHEEIRAGKPIAHLFEAL